MSFSIIPAFYFSDQSSFEDAISIATYQYEIVNEDYFHCIKRERGKEILVLRDLNLPYIVYSIDNNNTILLESNFDINSINKDNSRVLFRGYAKLSNIFGIERIQTEDESNSVMKWPLLLDYSDIKRNVSIVDQHHVLSLLDDKNFKPFFLKTFDKGTHNNTVNFIIDKDTKKSIIKTSERPDISNKNESLIYSSYLSKNKDSILTLYTKESFYFNEWVGENEKIPARYNSIDGDFIVSDIMNIKKDEKNRTIEYRAFIVGGEVNSLSRYFDFEHHEINKDIFDFCKKFVDKYKNKLPLFYILDVAETDKGIEIIELNPFELSGRYLENCPILLAKKLQNMSSNYAEFIINNKNIFIPDENINGDVNNFFKNFL